MADLYDIMENPYYPKWRSWIYKLRLKAPCNDPVNNLVDIVNSVCDIFNPHRNTAIRFGCNYTDGMEFSINRVGDGKIVLVEDIRDREYFHELIQLFNDPKFKSELVVGRSRRNAYQCAFNICTFRMDGTTCCTWKTSLKIRI